MKKYALLMGFVFIAGQASARVVERVLKDETTMVALELNSENVFCTELGYGSVQLKINVPELDFLAHFFPTRHCRKAFARCCRHADL
jgi:hypothetical protein